MHAFGLLCCCCPLGSVAWLDGWWWWWGWWCCCQAGAIYRNDRRWKIAISLTIIKQVVLLGPFSPGGVNLNYIFALGLPNILFCYQTWVNSQKSGDPKRVCTSLGRTQIGDAAPERWTDVFFQLFCCQAECIITDKQTQLTHLMVYLNVCSY